MSKKYNPVYAVCQAKLADLLYTYELSERLKDLTVTVNAVHPGAVATNPVYNDPDASLTRKFFYKLFVLFLKSPDKGAETILYLAASPEVMHVNGEYFIDKKSVPSSAQSYDK